jgi:hypothetical protein
LFFRKKSFKIKLKSTHATLFFVFIKRETLKNEQKLFLEMGDKIRVDDNVGWGGKRIYESVLIYFFFSFFCTKSSFGVF